MGYIGHFLVYVFAMISVIILALVVYKKFSVVNFTGKKSATLNVEETLNLSPRKTLYVVNAGGERFLIAGDLERTTLISKLENNRNNSRRDNVNTVNLSEFIKNEDVLYASQKQPVMKNLVRKLEMDAR